MRARAIAAQPTFAMHSELHPFASGSSRAMQSAVAPPLHVVLLALRTSLGK